MEDSFLKKNIVFRKQTLKKFLKFLQLNKISWNEVKLSLYITACRSPKRMKGLSDFLSQKEVVNMHKVNPEGWR